MLGLKEVLGRYTYGMYASQMKGAKQGRHGVKVVRVSGQSSDSASEAECCGHQVPRTTYQEMVTKNSNCKAPLRVAQ